MNPDDEAWKLAITNQTTEAYTRLLELDQARTGNADLALRLYWLLALNPDLDPVRTRHTWLAAALSQSRLAAPALELYQRELEANPAAGLSEPYSQLLKVEASSGSLLLLARQRLSASGIGRMWSVIADDLNELSTRADQFEEVAWLSYLVGVMGYVCFDRPIPLHERCGSLLAGLEHLNHGERWAFVELQQQQQKAHDWRNAKAVPTPVREVVRDAWVAPTTAWKISMIRAAAWAADDPVTALQKFDLAIRIPECQPILAAFQNLLDESSAPRPKAYPLGLIRGLIREFLLKHACESYSELRPELLRLLIREAIDPRELVQACAVDSGLGPRALVEHVRTDPTLRLVWRTVFSGPG